MDLNGIVSGVIGVVNPQVRVTIRVSTGYVTGADGSRAPAYAGPQVVFVQLQALEQNDILQADALNIQGVRRKMYVPGQVDGLVRANKKGGDLVTLLDGTVWKVAVILEQWPDWTCALIVLQDGA